MFDIYNGEGYLMRDVARAAAAAPTYFSAVKFDVPEGVGSPPSKKGDSFVLVDGGVFANNPAGYAIAEADAMVGGQGSKIRVLLVSLGTGRFNNPTPYEEATNWGILGWSDHLLNIIFSGPGLEDEIRRLVDPDKYFRLNVSLKDFRDDLDAAGNDNIDHLRTLGYSMIKDKENVEKLDALINELTQQRSAECLTRLERRF